MTDLDAVIRRSLTSFTDAVFSSEWDGMEREAVSLYAFGHLLREVRPGSVLFDPAQIGIEVRVPKPGVLRGDQPVSTDGKGTRICKDLTIWREPGTTWRSRVSPLAVMEWKAFDSKAKKQAAVWRDDVEWLRDFSAGCSEIEEFTGYAVCLDMRQQKFRLSCTRVNGGSIEPGWLELS